MEVWDETKTRLARQCNEQERLVFAASCMPYVRAGAECSWGRASDGQLAAHMLNIERLRWECAKNNGINSERRTGAVAGLQLFLKGLTPTEQVVIFLPTRLLGARRIFRPHTSVSSPLRIARLKQSIHQQPHGEGLYQALYQFHVKLNTFLNRRDDSEARLDVFQIETTSL